MKTISIFQPTLETKFVDINLWEKLQNLNLQLIIDRMLIKHSWSLERTNQAIDGYLKYLYMTQMFTQPITPTGDVDAIWHEHILHTNKYSIDCEKLFGKFLHHFPTPAKWIKHEKTDSDLSNCDSGTTNCGNTKPGDCSCSGPDRRMNWDNPKKDEQVQTTSFDYVKNFFFLS